MDVYVWTCKYDVYEYTYVARQKIRAASAGDFLFMRFALIGSLESPPSI